MKVTLYKPEVVDLKTVKIIVPIRYGTEDIPIDFPLRHDDIWEARVDVDTGIIEDWPVGQSGNLHMKVCDGGIYIVYDSNGVERLLMDEDYVPNGLIPGEYGDYIELDIDTNGKITNWPSKPSFKEFFEEQ